VLQVACQRLTASTLLMCWATLSLAAPTPAAWCKRLSARLPEVSTAACQASNLQPSGGVSTNGFPILFRQISAANQGVHKPLRVMLLGGIHGDELTASAIVFKWLLQIQMPLAHEFAWDVVPVLNPDGLLAVQPSRVNARGLTLIATFRRQAGNRKRRCTGPGQLPAIRVVFPEKRPCPKWKPGG
jgi:protein MpaA